MERFNAHHFVDSSTCNAYKYHYKHHNGNLLSVIDVKSLSYNSSHVCSCDEHPRMQHRIGNAPERASRMPHTSEPQHKSSRHMVTSDVPRKSSMASGSLTSHMQLVRVPRHVDDAVQRAH